MRKGLITFLLIFIACAGGDSNAAISEEEIQSRIDSAVELALSDAEEEFNKKLFNATSTTTTLASTTTTSTTTTTTLAPTTTTSTTTTTTLAPTTTTSTTTTIPKYAETYIGLDSDGNYQGVLLTEFKVNYQNISRDNFHNSDIFYINYIPGSYRLTDMSIGIIDENNNDYGCALDISVFNTMNSYQGNIGCDINRGYRNPYTNVANGPAGFYLVRVINIKAEFIDQFGDVRAVHNWYSVRNDDYSNHTNGCTISRTNLICNKLGGQPLEVKKAYFEHPSFNLTD